MTNEEAKEILMRNREYLLHIANGRQFDPDEIEALNMAIEALSNSFNALNENSNAKIELKRVKTELEFCKYCISRQEAIQEITKAELKDCTFAECKMLLGKLPSVQPTQDMTVQEYRKRLMDLFHETDHDELIAFVSLPTETEFRQTVSA